MKDHGIATQKCFSLTKTPFSKQVCALCNKWKRLISVGMHDEETWMCQKCFDDSGYKVMEEKK